MKKIEKGFFYHYKHDPANGEFNYAYEVLNIGKHTEIEDFDDASFVVYRPLYESAKVYQAGKLWDIRPFSMFAEDVTKEGKTFPRFTKIEDPELIERMKAKAAEMYD